jgi:hypothetical protein
MTNVVPISHNGRIAAAVLHGHAIIATDLPDQDRATVEAMCLYAAEILAGRIDGPYRDHDAIAYADAIAARRATHPTH